MAPDTLARVQLVADELAKRADEAERLARLPAETVAALREAGCFRMVTPARFGGDELPFSQALAAITALSRTDASAGWVVGQVALAQLIIGCCPEQAARDAYAAGPDLLAAGAVAIKGRAARTPDGWRTSGRWPFVSGCAHASWFYLNCAVQDGGGLTRTADGGVVSRMVVLPATDVVVEPTWQVLGLRGTGSHDVRVARAVCPEHRSFTVVPDEPAGAVVTARIARSSLLIAAVALGIAEGATAELIELAGSGRRPAMSPVPLSRSSLVQDQLGEAQVRGLAARAFLAERARAADDLESTSHPEERARLRAAATHVIGVASEVVDTAYRLAGGMAVYDSCPLQRRLRDMRSATQHFVAGRQSFAALGAILVGEPPGSAAG